jgi:hypothetical protein
VYVLQVASLTEQLALARDSAQAADAAGEAITRSLQQTTTQVRRSG